MHLPKLPTIFVKGGEERKAFFTIQAKELLAAGWVEKTEEEPKPVTEEQPAKEVAAESPAEEEKPRRAPRPSAKRVKSDG